MLCWLIAFGGERNRVKEIRRRRAKVEQRPANPFTFNPFTGGQLPLKKKVRMIGPSQTESGSPTQYKS